jgi:hypothetical protein
MTDRLQEIERAVQLREKCIGVDAFNCIYALPYPGEHIVSAWFRIKRQLHIITWMLRSETQDDSKLEALAECIDEMYIDKFNILCTAAKDVYEREDIEKFRPFPSDFKRDKKGLQFKAKMLRRRNEERQKRLDHCRHCEKFKEENPELREKTREELLQERDEFMNSN